MGRRLANRVRYALERLLLRGAHFRLLVIAALLAAFSLVGGLAAFELAGGFGGAGEAIWWAFLRLTDPGYLGDDQGTVLRAISTVLTIAGYVLFMGALIAIMAQWLNAKIDHLQRGETPLVARHHLVVLGWTERTPSIFQELISSEGRYRRMLRRLGRRQGRFRVALLADEVGPALRSELKAALGKDWDESQIVLRSGSRLRAEHLHRVDVARASVVILPASDYVAEGHALTDAGTVKALLTLLHETRHLDPGPRIVAEIQAPNVVDSLAALAGSQVDLVAGDRILGQLMVQAVRNPGITRVTNELLSKHLENELYVRHLPAVAGRAWREVAALFDGAIPLGLIPGGAVAAAGQVEPVLDPPLDTVVGNDELMVLLARNYEATAPAGGRPRAGAGAGKTEATAAAAPPGAEAPAPRSSQLIRILIMGWNDGVPTLLERIAGYRDCTYSVDIFAATPVAHREEELLSQLGERPELAVRHLQGDYTSIYELDRLDPEAYDSVILVPSDWLQTSREADARTLLGHMVLRRTLEQVERRPHVIVELMDPANQALMADFDGDLMVGPLVLSHLLAQVGLRRELLSVFDCLLRPGGPELAFRPAREWNLTGAEVTFGDVQAAAAARGEIALGIERGAAGGTPPVLELNPPRRPLLDLGRRDRIVVLRTV